jgi:CPA1 family monovalent cation:H+ antiporter
MEQFLATEALVIRMLLMASLVAMLGRRLRVPHTIALVVAGLLTFGQAARIEMTPELILALFVPPLVFEAALRLPLRRLRDDLLPITLLAVPGVLLTTAAVALVVHLAAGLPPASALAFGALVSATDPVAVVALFRALRVPRRLAVLVEGESLLNDGTALVVFNLVLAAAVAGAPPGGWAAAPVAFLHVGVGGLLVGLGLGWVAARLIASVDDHLIQTTLTTVLAFGSYLLAERLHVSGVLAAVGAGLVNGNQGREGLSPATRVALFDFWEYVAFVANSLVFLMIGLEVNLPQLAASAGPVAVAVLAVLVSRALTVYGLSALLRLLGRPLPGAYRHVLFWGGLRGALGLALALSLPPEIADRERLKAMAFGVVLFTLLAQGLTMNGLLVRLGVAQRDDAGLAFERLHGRLTAARAARDHLRRLSQEGVLPATTWERLEPELEAEMRGLLDELRALLLTRPGLEEGARGVAEREGLRARRSALAGLLNDGAISEQVYEELVARVDAGPTAAPPDAPPAGGR